MSLADTIRGRRNRPDPGVDPAFAFGAEEQTMEEIRRQNFVPPERKGPGVAARAGAMLSSLRQKIAGDEDPAFDGFGTAPEPEAPPRAEAPVYSSEIYDQPAAPDMGWENPFSPNAPRSGAKAAPSRQSRNSGSRTRTAPPTYAPPANAAPAYAPPTYDGYYEGGYAQPAYAPYEPYAPGPEAAYASYEAQPARTRRNAPPQPVYREPAPDPIPAETGYDPFYGPEVGDPYAEAGYDPRYAPEYPPEAEGWYGPDYMPRSYPRKKAYKPGDFKYFFWSGSIVAGMVLTIVAFVYASIV